MPSSSQPSQVAARRASIRVVGWDRVAIIGLLLIGVLIACYPAAASWFSAVNAQSATGSYSQNTQRLTPEQRAALLKSAQEYNASLPGGLIIDPFTNTAGVEPLVLDDAARRYLAQLDSDPSGVMSVLTIPGLKLKLPIFHGATDATLRKGVGHLYGSSLPIGGPNTHTVLTAHAGLAESELFTHLDKLKPGDDFSLETLGTQMHYRVSGIEVVDPSQVSMLGTQPGRDLVTLVTCTPIGINSHRLLVHAERVDVADASSGPSHITLPFPWWMIPVGLATVVFCVTLVRSIVTHRRRRRALAPQRQSAQQGPEFTGT